ncbi:MAG: type II toxin-antitoxin system RelE/ParE family toxin [Chloroflexota bacterium]
MRIALTEAAEEDFAAIYTYYAGRFAAADRVIGTILKAINGLTLFPRMGRPGDVPETRERIVTRYPYRIVYHIAEAEQVIEVWGVLHRERQWPPAD